MVITMMSFLPTKAKQLKNEMPRNDCLRTKPDKNKNKNLKKIVEQK